MKNRIVRLTNTIGELLIIYAVVLGIATVAYSFFEHKALLDAFWWACVTAMTVGYGDMYPLTLGGRITGIVLMHTTVLFILPLLIARMAMSLIENHDAFSHEEQEGIKESLTAIKQKLGI